MPVFESNVNLNVQVKTVFRYRSEPAHFLDVPQQTPSPRLTAAVAGHRKTQMDVQIAWRSF